MASIGTALSSYPSSVWRYRHATLFLVVLLLTSGRRQTDSQSFADAFHLNNAAVSPRSKQLPTRSPLENGAAGVARGIFGTITTTVLEAKNSRKNKKRSGGPRGGGRRGKAKRDGMPEDEDETSGRNANTKQVRDPKSFRKRLIELERPSPSNEDQQQQHFLLPLRVCSVEVDDREWWEQEGNDNPFGARLWPSALAISEFLVSFSSFGGGDDSGRQSPRLEEYEILELGCGAGLVSIVAAECGASVVATDISPLTLKLCRMGWKETQKVRMKEELAKKKKMEQKQKQKLQQFRKLHNSDSPTEDTGGAAAAAATTNKPPTINKASETKPIVAKQGTLDTSILDFVKNPLPIVSNEETSDNPGPPKMVIGTAMLYHSGLAKMLAQRAMEACRCGAWVVIGDDDTGEREGGRKLFISELNRIEIEEGVVFPRIWTKAKVKSKALQWNEKQVIIMHLNAPEDVQEQLKNDPKRCFNPAA